jgi:hypothetical protein
LTTRPIFRSVWWVSNALLILALVATAWCGVWEYSTRKYLRGFSDAVVPQAESPQQKVEAILAWMKNGPPRLELRNLDELSPRDPQNTLNYRQLLQVCGSATNAFLNLARSSGLDSRRLLLLTPDRTTNHVVAEILLGDRWVIVDPTYRVMLKDAHGNLLTRKDLQDQETFRQATSAIPNYPPEYNYARFAHVRLAALPFQGPQLRRFLEYVLPGWDEYLDWGLLLERRSFFFLFLSATSLIALTLLRLLLGWVADHRLQIPRFHLRTNLSRATAAFFSTPEIK